MNALSSELLSPVVESCVERVKEGLERTLTRAMQWTLHSREEGSVSKLCRADLVFLMAVSALANNDTEVSGMLLKEVERWSVFPQIKKSMYGKMDAEWEVPREILDRALTFASFLKVSGLFFVPPELPAYILKLITKAPTSPVKAIAKPTPEPRKIQTSSYLHTDKNTGATQKVHLGEKTKTPKTTLNTPSEAFPKVRQACNDSRRLTIGFKSSTVTGGIPHFELHHNGGEIAWESLQSQPVYLLDAVGSGVDPNLHLLPWSREIDAEMSRLVAWRQLWKGVKKDDGQLVKRAVLSGADFNMVRADKGYRTPLALAASKGRVEAVRALVRLGAQVDGRADEEKRTALHWASAGGHVAVVRELLDDGAEIEAKDSGKYTALHLASANGHDAVVRKLVMAGASVGTKGSEGYTPLHLAAMNGHEAAVLELLKAGANVEAVAICDYTPLHKASMNGHLATVRLLVEYWAADINSRTLAGNTPLYWAEYKGHTAVAEYLRSVGATK